MPSIKDAERDRRSNSERDMSIKISGPNNSTLQTGSKLYATSFSKKELSQYLIELFQDDSFSHIIADKTLNVTFESSCYSFIVVEGEVKRTEEPSLFCNHEEADTRIIGYPGLISTPAKVLIRNLKHVQIISGITLYLEVGLISKNTLR